MPYSFRKPGVNREFNTIQGLQVNKGKGEIVRFGIEDDTQTLSAGKLCYLSSEGKWLHADADAVATGGEQLLAIALGDSVSAGMLVKGYFHFASVEGTFAKGKPFYVSDVAGSVGFTAPSGSGDFVLTLGYGIDTANVCMFNPSRVAVVLA